MNRSRRPSLRASACLVLTALAVTALAACGDEESQELAYTLSGDGKTAKLEGPSSADSGLTEISFENSSGGEADLQLIRVEGERSPAETADGLKSASNGRPFPEWFFAGGGTGATPAGETKTVTQVLEPGTYYAFEVEGGLDPKSAVRLDVGGEASDEELAADATVSAFEYGFESDGLASGSTEVAFENTGVQPHHIVYAPLNEGATAEDVESFFKTEKGKPPFNDEDFRSTAVIEGGEAQLVDLDLEPGRYALLCFISDREGGPPHAFKGMIDEVEVE